MRWNVKKILCGVLVALVLVSMARRFYIYHLNPDLPCGPDKFMLDWHVKQRQPVYMVTEFYFSDVFALETGWNRLRDELRRQLTYPDPADALYWVVDVDRAKVVRRPPGQSVDDLCLVLDGLPHNFDIVRYQRIDLHRGRDIFFRLNVADKSVGIFWNHAVMDGVRVFNGLLVKAFAKTEKKINVPKYKYYPVVSDVMGYLAQLEVAALISNKKALLLKTPNPVFERYLFHTLPVAKLKKLQRDVGEVKLVACLAAAYLRRLFDCRTASANPKGSLKVGLIYGFDNDRFINNYTFILLEVKPAPLHDMCRALHAEIKDNYRLGLWLYDAMTLQQINMEATLKEHAIDVIFSPAYTQSMMNGFSNMKNYNYDISYPVYTGSFTVGDQVFLNTTLATPDIDAGKFERLALL